MNRPSRACVATAILGLAIGSAMAQQGPSPSASSPADRAVRDADKVYRMILMHADKPRRVVRDERTAGLPSAATAPASAPAALATMSADALTPLSVPAQANVELPMLTSPAPVLAKEALPSMKAVPQLATVSIARPPARLELLASVEPDFPQRVLRAVGAGSVVVEFDVAPDGSVARTAIVRSPNRGLNAAALAAVSAWRFKPPGVTMPGSVELKFE